VSYSLKETEDNDNEAAIQTGYLPSTSIECFRYTKRLGVKIKYFITF